MSEQKYGQATLKWQLAKGGGFAGAVILGGKRVALIEDADEEKLLARLRNEAGRLHPDYVGFDGAMRRYLRFFPGGLYSAANASSERGYKERAAERLRASLSIEKALDADVEDATALAKAGIQTNMLSPFEAARFRDTLQGETGGRFLRGAAAFATGDYDAGALAMAAAVQPHGRISWPILTYLPFLWDYERHMFLKPTVTADFADRVGHDFHHAYSPEPNAETYRSLLDLVDTTRSAIASLQPRDNIDIQSFIWVVGEYREGDERE
ncbi:hypothetical protein ACT9ST_09815 [Sphingobium limneticum]